MSAAERLGLRQGSSLWIRATAHGDRRVSFSHKRDLLRDKGRNDNCRSTPRQVRSALECNLVLVRYLPVLGVPPAVPQRCCKPGAFD